MSGAYFAALTRKVDALNEMDAMYARLMVKPLPVTRWYLYVNPEGAFEVSTVGEFSSLYRCVAAGSQAACHAAARLLAS